MTSWPISRIRSSPIVITIFWASLAAAFPSTRSTPTSAWRIRPRSVRESPEFNRKYLTTHPELADLIDPLGLAFTYAEGVGGIAAECPMAGRRDRRCPADASGRVGAIRARCGLAPATL